MNCYLGIDIGSISTKGVIIDKENKILANSYLYTEGNPIQAVKKVFEDLLNTKVITDENRHLMGSLEVQF